MFHNPRLTVCALALCLPCLSAGRATAGDAQGIVGRWDNPVSDAAYVRFYGDGTFKEVTLLKTTEGRYRLLPEGVIEMRSPGVIYGENVAEIKYRLSGDALELKFLGNWVKYARAR